MRRFPHLARLSAMNWLVEHTARDDRHSSDAGGARERGRAVIYLRVSSARQMERGHDPAGISIPAQREACRRKAEQPRAHAIGGSSHTQSRIAGRPAATLRGRRTGSRRGRDMSGPRSATRATQGPAAGDRVPVPGDRVEPQPQAGLAVTLHRTPGSPRSWRPRRTVRECRLTSMLMLRPSISAQSMGQTQRAVRVISYPFQAARRRRRPGSNR